MTLPTESMPPRVVIDTQSVLDWLYFLHPACADWHRQQQAGLWQWVTTSSMRDELAHVLQRQPGGARWAGREVDVLPHFDQRAMLLPEPPAPPIHWPRCTDRDDQKFIDLALTCGARWLVSRDKAVLKLARKARLLRGVTILSPADWRAQDHSPA